LLEDVWVRGGHAGRRQAYGEGLRLVPIAEVCRG
jgi:hypothetical protein